MTATVATTIVCDDCDTTYVTTAGSREARQQLRRDGWTRKRILNRHGYDVLADLCKACTRERAVGPGDEW
jgi:hypothetical protein